MKIELCEPLVHLLNKRQARLVLPPFMLVWAIYGLPPAVSFVASGGESTAVFVAVLNLCLMLGLPIYLFQAQFSLLLSLRKGRCFEEMISSGFSPQAVVDTLALQSFPILARLGISIWPLLVAGSLLAPYDFRMVLFPAAVAWPVLTALVAVSSSYLCQAIILRTQTSKRMVGLVCLLGLTLGTVGWMGQSPGLNIALMLSSAAAAVVYARYYAIVALSRPDLLAASSAGLLSVRGYRNRWLPSWSDNAIVARERARTASVGGSVAGFVVLRMLTIIIPAWWGLLICSWGTDAIHLGWPLVGAFLFLRSALITVGAVVGERVQKTWEPLVQSGLDFAEFRRGWLALGTLPVWLESIPIFFVVLLGSFALVERSSIPNPILGCAICAVFLILSGTGAYAGLAISSISGSYRDAMSTLLSRALRQGILWLGIWGLLYAGLHAVVENNIGYKYVVFYHLVSFEWTMVAAPLLAALLVSLGMQRWSNRTLATGAGYVDTAEALEAGLDIQATNWWPLAAAGLGTVLAQGYVRYACEYSEHGYRWSRYNGLDQIPAWTAFGPSLVVAGLLGMLATRLPFKYKGLFAGTISGLVCLSLNRQVLTQQLGHDPFPSIVQSPETWIFAIVLVLILRALARARRLGLV